MPVEIFLAVLVLAVVILVGADFFRTASDSPHEPVGDLSYDAGQATFGEPRAVATPILPLPARAGGAGQAFDAGLPAPPQRTGPLAGGRASHRLPHRLPPATSPPPATSLPPATSPPPGRR